MKQWLLAGVLALATFAGAAADDYPTKPITVIVPFPAGGPTDSFARSLAAEVAKRLGQMIVIDNRSGAGNTLGSREAVGFLFPTTVDAHEAPAAPEEAA